jgi:NADH-quinone oxidoreductase subunit J
MAYVFTIAAVVGAIAVYLVLPHRQSMPRFGGLLAGGVLAMTLAWLGSKVSPELRPSVYYYAFTLIAAASGVRVITHPRPVYAALYFVLVVLSTAGMLVMLQAEFMAFAMIIIYAGAILVTYMFVIMLATMPVSAGEPESSPDYDRTARQPILAVLMGFALLGVLATVMFDPAGGELPRLFSTAGPQPLHDLSRLTDVSVPRNHRRIADALRDLNHMDVGDEVFAVDLERGWIDVRSAAGSRPRRIPLDDDVLAAIVPNIDQVGLNLFKGHTLGIELAAVILLLAMVGAIVIARRMVPETHVTMEG